MPTPIDHYCLSILDNLQSDVAQLELDEGVRIIRLDLITDKRGRGLIGEDALEVAHRIRADGPRGVGYRLVPYRQDNFSPTLSRIAETSNHALEYRFSGEIPDPFNAHYDREVPLQRFSTALVSLRLLKPGVVGRFQAMTIVSGDPSGLETATRVETINYRHSLMNTIACYKLREDDVDYLRKIYHGVKECTKRPIQIALGRFDAQYSKESQVDKLIDLIIAFEALYLGTEDELKFRLALRSGRHLGVSNDDRQEVFNCIATAYDLRSKIVHGTIGSLMDDKAVKKIKEVGCQSPHLFLEHLASLLRRSILSILLAGCGTFGKHFHASLDRAIIRGE